MNQEEKLIDFPYFATSVLTLGKLRYRLRYNVSLDVWILRPLMTAA